jgi:uncharacterized damage-inducible protein DinB
MSSDTRPAGANIHYLKQGAELIRRLDDATFGTCEQNPYRGGVGAQIRHCIDFYQCFLDGLEPGAIDYNRRGRSHRLETDRAYALDRIESLCRGLADLTFAQTGRELDVRAERGSDDAQQSSRSSVGRELQFLISHTIHHYALVAIMLKLQGIDVAHEHPDFGVAPSTLAHWKENGSLVS